MGNTILIGHGSGGLMTGNLIKEVFLKNFENPLLRTLSDSAVIDFSTGHLAFTTDSFVIDPVFFPGGDIGKLAVCGTVNDLSVCGAKPLYLSAAFILEEGLPITDLEQIVSSMAGEAKNAGVMIVTGDTKVVKKGQCDKIFINTSGIGRVENKHTGISRGEGIMAGDAILVNGFLGDHEIAILSAREDIKFENPLLSDVASLNSLIHSLLDAGIAIRFMRDITRGGLATILSEIAVSMKVGIFTEEHLIPLRDEVKGICEVYGFNPLYLANEGKVLMVVSEADTQKALDVLHRHPLGKDAAKIGNITSERKGKVLMRSGIGGTRIIDKLTGEQLPRIC